MAKNATSSDKAPAKPIRLWPGVVLVVLQWLGRFALPALYPEGASYGILAAFGGGLAILLWWAFFSRVPHLERWGGLALVVVAFFATRPLLHESIATGAMGMLFLISVIPFLSLALVLAAVACRHLGRGPRRVATAVVILLACGGWTLVRTGGFTGDFDSDFAWRWSQTPEERLLAQQGEEPAVVPAAVEAPPAVAPEAEWPGFRGRHRDGVAAGARIATDWSASPPEELWRRPVGPGWSSFAVRGDRLYTQEQRGEDEVVSCYHLATGEPLWQHRDTTRFWESNAGAGARSTPTLAEDRVYTLGATGIVNALDAGDGTVLWSRDAAADTGAKLPLWGFSGSPLVVGDLVVVAASGMLVAYEADTGEPSWFGPEGGEGYSSPQLLTLDGVAQIVQLSGDDALGIVPADGRVLWRHPWDGFPIVQPARTADGDLLIAVDASSGLRRLDVELGADGWSAAELWTSRGLKPYFNDFVVHEGHAYGFDGRILAAIDLADGERRWKGGRYGNGQLILLPEQELLLVLSEKGELALVEASPDGFTELARRPAIEGKTWNHPVLAGDVLLVRNAQEMAAFRLAAGAR